MSRPFRSDTRPTARSDRRAGKVPIPPLSLVALVAAAAGLVWLASFLSCGGGGGPSLFGTAGGGGSNAGTKDTGSGGSAPDSATGKPGDPSAKPGTGEIKSVTAGVVETPTAVQVNVQLAGNEVRFEGRPVTTADLRKRLAQLADAAKSPKSGKSAKPVQVITHESADARWQARQTVEDAVRGLDGVTLMAPAGETSEPRAK